MPNRAIPLLLLFLAFVSCNDDDELHCDPEPTSVIINNQVFMFQQTGRGIDLRPDGTYDFHVSFSSYNAQTETLKRFSVFMTFQETGEQVIDRLLYYQNEDNEIIQVDLVEQNFQNTVITNAETCFLS